MAGKRGNTTLHDRLDFSNSTKRKTPAAPPMRFSRTYTRICEEVNSEVKCAVLQHVAMQVRGSSLQSMLGCSSCTCANTPRSKKYHGEHSSIEQNQAKMSCLVSCQTPCVLHAPHSPQNKALPCEGANARNGAPRSPRKTRPQHSGRKQRMH